ncbi:MAG: LuxR C-terminal-related transcriptional regulator [Myxococcota bacterium]
MAPRTRGALKMVAAHLVAGWRLRFKAPSVAALQESDAVFSLSGRLEHVRQSAVTETEPGSLPLAVKRLVAGRQLRREAPERALELWTALVSGEWSLVERVDTDGKRFLVARKNPIGVPAPGALTPRERVVAYYVARGHSLKLVGYEVGLAPATVTELLQSALRKLGLASKGELVALFASRDD